jgi:quinol monooxygenase YgiN
MKNDDENTCEECGFAYEIDRSADAGGRIRALAAQLSGELLAASEPATRRTSAQWSPLEYACHVRDVLLVQRERVLAVRRGDLATTTPMGRDERVVHDGYIAQEPEFVALQLVEASRLFANVLDGLGNDDWDRTLIYNHPTPRQRSLRWVAVHTAHELHHHLLDVRQQSRVAARVPAPSSVSWSIELHVDERNRPAFIALTDEMIEASGDEPGTLVYERFAHGSDVYLHERYADSVAAVQHLQMFAARFRDRFEALVTRRRVVVLGTPTASLRALLDQLDPIYAAPLGGFARLAGGPVVSVGDGG